jgi:hypothetical protein
MPETLEVRRNRIPLSPQEFVLKAGMLRHSGGERLADNNPQSMRHALPLTERAGRTGSTIGIAHCQHAAARPNVASRSNHGGYGIEPAADEDLQTAPYADEPREHHDVRM